MNDFEPLYEYVNPDDMPGIRQIPTFINDNDNSYDDIEQIRMIEDFTVTGGSLVTVILVILLILLLL